MERDRLLSGKTTKDRKIRIVEQTIQIVIQVVKCRPVRLSLAHITRAPIKPYSHSVEILSPPFISTFYLHLER